MAKHRRCPFIAQLKAMNAEGNSTFLNSQQRAWAMQLAEYAGVETTWTRIEKICGRQDVHKMRDFIVAVLIARWQSEGADKWPDYAGAARNAQKVLDFLKPSRHFLPPPLPMEGLAELQSLLDRAIARMRQFAGHRAIHISRKRSGVSRQVGIFMQLASLAMKNDYFGRWLDNEVTDFTNALFPDADVSPASVRAARRANTRKENWARTLTKA
jgi:hypothetical protein